MGGGCDGLQWLSLRLACGGRCTVPDENARAISIVKQAKKPRAAIACRRRPAAACTAGGAPALPALITPETVEEVQRPAFSGAMMSWTPPENRATEAIAVTADGAATTRAPTDVRACTRSTTGADGSRGTTTCSDDSTSAVSVRAAGTRVHGYPMSIRVPGRRRHINLGPTYVTFVNFFRTKCGASL